MTRSFLCVLVAVAFPILCGAAVTKLSPVDRKVLEDSSPFQTVRGITNLPPAVVALCADDKGRLAEPGGRWEATDVITDHTLPTKRLFWAAVGGEYWVVHYERGGRGHSFHVLVAKHGSVVTKTKVLWRGVGEQLKDYTAFLAALASNKLDDRLDYAH